MRMPADAIVIVGAGQAGARAADALRGAGFGDRILLIGDERELPYERPALSKGVLLGQEDPASTRIHTADWYAALGIEVRSGVRGVAIDPGGHRLLLSDGSFVAYAKLLLTTGSRVRPLTQAPDLAGIHYLRTHADCKALAAELVPGRRLVVVGGGFLGLEVAAAARMRGLAVTIVERQPQILERSLPAGIAEVVAEMHRGRGVDVRVGSAVARIHGEARVTAVELADGTLLPADAVVIAIGVIPNTELAESAGAESDDGLVVDQFGRTTLPDVYAAGDVTNHPNPILGRRVRLESWQNAQNQAIAVARNMVGPATPYAEVPWFWTDQYGFNIQMMGVTEDGLEVVWRGDRGAARSLAFGLRRNRVAMAVAFNNPAELRFARRLIEQAVRVEARQLADPSRRLKDLAAPDAQAGRAVAGIK